MTATAFASIMTNVCVVPNKSTIAVRLRSTKKLYRFRSSEALPKTTTFRQPHFTSMTSTLLRISRIVEQHCQLNAAMPKLRKVGFCWIRRIEIRRCIVWRKQNQRVQKSNQRVLVVGSERNEAVARGLRFPAMAQNDVV